MGSVQREQDKKVKHTRNQTQIENTTTCTYAEQHPVEHTHTAPESAREKQRPKIQNKDICVYTIYKQEGYRACSKLNIEISGRMVTFVVDSGAMTSVLTPSALPN